MKKIVLSLGGSIIIPDTINSQLLRDFRDMVLEFVDQGYQFVIFTGGGATARLYMDGARAAADMTDAQLDWLGIYSSRLNAHLVRMVFADMADQQIIIDPTLPLTPAKPIVVGAGWKPGWSTDYDAVMVAAQNQFDRVINLSNIAQAYDKDPRQFPDAKPLDDVTWAEFRTIVGDDWTPGLNAPFDPIASKLAQEHGIEVIIADGTNLQNTKQIIAGQQFVGTRVYS